MPQEDHDLLIALGTEMRGVRNDIKELKDGVYPHIAALEKDKADKVDMALLRVQVESMQKKSDKYFQIMTLFTAAAGAVFSLLLFHIFKQ